MEPKQSKSFMFSHLTLSQFAYVRPLHCCFFWLGCGCGPLFPGSTLRSWFARVCEIDGPVGSEAKWREYVFGSKMHQIRIQFQKQVNWSEIWRQQMYSYNLLQRPSMGPIVQSKQNNTHTQMSVMWHMVVKKSQTYEAGLWNTIVSANWLLASRSEHESFDWMTWCSPGAYSWAQTVCLPSVEAIVEGRQGNNNANIYI